MCLYCDLYLSLFQTGPTFLQAHPPTSFWLRHWFEYVYVCACACVGEIVTSDCVQYALTLLGNVHAQCVLYSINIYSFFAQSEWLSLAPQCLLS